MKRLMFVTYYFPPSGGPGVQRSLKFVKYLPDFGWDVTVLTVDPEHAAYTDLDPGLEREIPLEAHLIRTRSWDPYAVYARFTGKQKDSAVGVGFVSHAKPGFREKAARWIRANLFLPDARAGWTIPAKKAVEKELRSGRYDAVFSTGPPHSTHLVARRVRKNHHLPWLADLRDAWPPDSYAHLLPMSRLARQWDARTMHRTLSAADLLITVSDALGTHLRRGLDTPVEIIPNGFDEDDFLGMEPISDDAFTIVYTGNLAAEQNPVGLWHAIKERRAAREWARLKVRLVGHIAIEVLSSIEQAGLRSIVEVLPYVEHHEAIRHMAGADLLLLCINRVPNPDGIVTGKLYEYLASGRPVMCFSPTDGEAARIVSETEAGFTVRYEDAASAARNIDRHFAAWDEGARLDGASRDRIQRYSRRAQAGRLAELLDRLILEVS